MIRVTLTCSVCAKEQAHDFEAHKVDSDTMLTDLIDVMKFRYAQVENELKVFCSHRCKDKF